MTVIARIKFLEERNNVLRRRVSDLEKLNKQQFDALHKSELRVQQLEAENALLRARDND
nr:MAG TPA: Protein SOGA [Caudoviricetes sp.]